MLAGSPMVDTKTVFCFFWISSYVGFVPISDVLAIFVSDRRCEFSYEKGIFRANSNSYVDSSTRDALVL